MKRSFFATIALALAACFAGVSAYAQPDPPDKPVFSAVYEVPASASHRVHATYHSVAQARAELAQPGIAFSLTDHSCAAVVGDISRGKTRKVACANASVPLDDGILQVKGKSGGSKKGKSRGGTKT